jgi:hypothetical protein
VVTGPSETTDRRGRTHARKGWYPVSESQLTTVPSSGTDADEHDPAANGRPTVPVSIDGTGAAPDAGGPLIDKGILTVNRQGARS